MKNLAIEPARKLDPNDGAVAPDQLLRARCRDCDYPLKNLPAARCPECGRAFDPRNPRTFHAGLPMPSWLKWWMGPIGWPTATVAGISAVIVLWLTLEPESMYPLCVFPVVFFFVAGLPLGAAHALRSGARSVLAGLFGRPSADFGDETRRWLALYGLTMLVLLCIGTGLHWRIAFYVYLPAFESLRAEVEQMPLYTRTTDRVGPWKVHAEHHHPGVTIFHVKTSGWFGGGFICDSGQVGMHGYLGGTSGWLIGDWIWYATD